MNINQQIEMLESKIDLIKLEIEDKQGEIATLQSNIETFEYSCDEDQFNEFLDDVEQSVTIYGIEFYPSDILKNCDPIAYRCGKSDYEADIDFNDIPEYQDMLSELDDLQTELDDLQTELDDLESQLDDLQSELDDLESED